MTPQELEIALSELEEKVDRLRNLYEQYFLGFEKLVPSVPRKDVDRRFAILRKEQIRNTAMRFRFQMVTQRFQTYSMHWVRICRQIEDGTYKKHLQRAHARFGDEAQRPPEAAAAEAEADAGIEVDLDEFDTSDVDSLLADLEAPAAAAAHAPRPEPAARPIIQTPGTSFAVPGHREVLEEIDRSTPPPLVRSPTDRALRGAALPPGARPLIVRRRDEGDPTSAPSLRPRLWADGKPSIPVAAQGPTTPSVPATPAISAAPPMRATPPPTRGAPSPPAGPPMRVPGLPPPAGAGSPLPPPSSPRLPPPSRPQLEARVGPPTAGRIAAAPPTAPGSSPSAGRLPVAPPAMPPSANRLPLPAPLPPPSTRRIAAGPPPPARQGAPRPPAMSRVPTIRGLSADDDHAPASPAPPRAADRDSAPLPPDPPSARPRAPLPLPSQASRPPVKKT